MKTIISLLLICLIAQSLCFESPEEVQKQLAWKVQCRIKQKGTFKLSHLRNKDAEFAKLQEKATLLEDKITKAVGNPTLQEQTEEVLTIVNEQIADIEEKHKDYTAEFEAEQELLNGEIEDFEETMGGEDVDAETMQETATQLSTAKEALADLLEEKEQYDNGRNNSMDLFMEDDDNSIELPEICRRRLTTHELLELGVKGADFKDVWLKAWGGMPEEGARRRAHKKAQRKHHHHRFNVRRGRTSQDDEEEAEPAVPTYTNMVPLDVTQFNLFYQTITMGVEGSDPDAIYTGSSGVADPADEANLIFQTALFDKSRQFINWLEFWVYMCNDGNQPKDEEYMVPSDAMDVEQYSKMDPLFEQLGGEEEEGRKMKHRFMKKSSHKSIHKVHRK